MNCLYIGSRNPLNHDLLYELVRAIKETAIAIRGSSIIDAVELDRLLDEFAAFHLDGTPIASSHFIELVHRLGTLCSGGSEPVIVFDNIDQLDPDAVPEIGELARAVHLSTGLCVMTAMRPATHATQSELSSAKGAFYKFLIEVNPPDIRTVIRQRLRLALHAAKLKRITIETGVSFAVADVERSISSLCEKILNPRTQEIYIRDICNNNVRLALGSFITFCRYRDLKYNLLFDVGDAGAEALHGSWFDHFLDGLMIGDMDYFVDGRSPISCILYFENNGTIDYTILYVVLCLLEWDGRPFLDLTSILRWMEAFGYERGMSRAAIEHLMKRGLLYCPETEDKIRRVRNLRISNSGRYYLEFLVENPQYLFNAVYDVPLPHGKWREGEVDVFPIRMNSVWELIEQTFAAERVRLEEMIGDFDRVSALGAIDHAGLLTGRLCKAASRLLADARHARSDLTKSAARDYENLVRAMIKNVGSGEARVRDELTRRRLIPSRSPSVEVLEESIGLSNFLRLRVPRQLAPAKRNAVSIEVDMEGLEDTHPIVAVWQASSKGSSYGEIVELTRTSERNVYRGDFAISNVRSIVDFPKSSVTVFSATDPICVTRLPAVASSSDEDAGHGTTHR